MIAEVVPSFFGRPRSPPTWQFSHFAQARSCGHLIYTASCRNNEITLPRTPHSWVRAWNRHHLFLYVVHTNILLLCYASVKYEVYNGEKNVCDSWCESVSTKISTTSGVYNVEEKKNVWLIWVIFDKVSKTWVGYDIEKNVCDWFESFLTKLSKTSVVYVNNIELYIMCNWGFRYLGRNDSNLSQTFFVPLLLISKRKGGCVHSYCCIP